MMVMIIYLDTIQQREVMMVTVTMAIAAIPIHVATRAGWIPENYHDYDGDDDDDDDFD